MGDKKSEDKYGACYIFLKKTSNVVSEFTHLSDQDEYEVTNVSTDNETNSWVIMDVKRVNGRATRIGAFVCSTVNQRLHSKSNGERVKQFLMYGQMEKLSKEERKGHTTTVKDIKNFFSVAFDVFDPEVEQFSDNTKHDVKNIEDLGAEKEI